MSKRKLPFGYEICGGVIIKERAEAETVTDIYSSYISGASFGEITDKLLKGNVVYDKDRAWNKNIVARILEDKRYVGDDVYPQIISGEEYTRVLELREQKMYRADETAVQKYLRRLCGRKITEYVESETLRLLNLLMRNPEIIIDTKGGEIEARSALQADLEQMILFQPVDEAAAKQLIHKIAEEQYDSLSNAAYETERLRSWASANPVMGNLSVDALKSTVSKIRMSKQNVSLQLKNGQVISEENFV